MEEPWSPLPACQTPAGYCVFSGRQTWPANGILLLLLCYFDLDKSLGLLEHCVAVGGAQERVGGGAVEGAVEWLYALCYQWSRISNQDHLRNTFGTTKGNVFRPMGTK